MFLLQKCGLLPLAVSMVLGWTLLSPDTVPGADAEMEENSCTLWPVSSMRRVFPDSQPNSANSACENDKTEPLQIVLAQAQNEYESFQLAFSSPRGSSEILFELTDLVHDEHPESRISKANIQWQQTGYVLTKRVKELNVEDGARPDWCPDPLLPVVKGTCPPGQTVSFWFTVYVPRASMPGTYHGTITVCPAGVPPQRVALTVTVWDLELPAQCRLPNAFALMDGFLEKVYQKKITPVFRKKWNEFLLQFRIMPEGDITRTEFPDLDTLSELQDKGLGLFNITNLATSRGDAPWTCYSPVEFYSQENKELFLQQLSPYVAELRKRGQAEQAYVYAFDERGPEFQPAMTEFFGMIKENFPEVATFTTALLEQDAELFKKLNVDWFCPKTSHYNYDRAEECRAKGHQVWAYICCDPRFPYANIMCRFPLIDARILGWQAWQQKYDGLLYWALNFWGHPSQQPIDPNAGLNLNWSIETCLDHPIYGDGQLLYAGINEQPIASIRLANLRDGFEDYDLLCLVAERIGDRESVLQKMAPVFQSPTEFTRDPNVLKINRDKIAELIK